MTIASEISRLQTDKECMRQAIIGKGVDVAASVSFDDYAACIAAIPSGPSINCVDFLLVGGGGGGAGRWGAGGGGGGVISCSNFTILGGNQYNVTIGLGGAGCYGCGLNGGDSSFSGFVATGGGGGGGIDHYDGFAGGSGGGGYRASSDPGGQGVRGQGYDGGKGGMSGWGSSAEGAGGGGGGAGGNGYNGKDGTSCTSKGGIGISSDISGQSVRYAGGGSGADPSAAIPANCGGAAESASATNYGGGGGGGGNQGNGYQGVFILRYLTSCGYNISGGTKYTCGAYTIHCFTSDGTLTII